MGHEVQQTRWDRLVRRVSGSIGPGSRVSETLTELFPVLDVENVPAELLVLGGTRMASGFTSESAVAANFQFSELFNPVGSGSIITLLSMAIDSTSQNIAMALTSGSFTNNNPTRVGFTDGRLLDASVPVGQCRDETAGAVGVQHYFLDPTFFAANLFEPTKAIAVLSPGTGYATHTVTVNTSMTIGYIWIERAAEPSELSL